jgi:hypothetical protein
MATYVITGRDVNLSFAGGTDIDAQATSAVLTKTNDRQVYQTLDGEAYKTTNVEATFDLRNAGRLGQGRQRMRNPMDSSRITRASYRNYNDFSSWRTVCI